MIIFINGQRIDVKNANLETVLELWHAKPPYAVAVNQHFIPQQAYPTTTLNERDAVEIVTPIAGG